MTAPKRWRALLAVLVGGLAGVVPAAALPVSDVQAADTDEVLLSADGTTWVPELAVPLVDPGLVWVPGDVETGTLYARNASGGQATAVVTVLLDGDVPLVDELRVRTRLGSGAWTDGLRSDATELAPGEVIPIGLEVAFDSSATNASRQQTAGLDVTVTHAGSGGPGPGDDNASGPGVLPRTGANLLLPTLVAAGAVLLGSVLLRHRNQRERRTEHG